MINVGQGARDLIHDGVTPSTVLQVARGLVGLGGNVSAWKGHPGRAGDG